MSRKDTLQFPDHSSYKALSGLTLNQLSRDGSFGRTRNYDQGAYVWQTGDTADRVYFLQRRQVSIIISDLRRHFGWYCI